MFWHMSKLAQDMSMIFFFRMKSPKDGCKIFNNLAEDEELFGAEGDYQFQIYRFSSLILQWNAEI